MWKHFDMFGFWSMLDIVLDNQCIPDRIFTACLLAQSAAHCTCLTCTDPSAQQFLSYTLAATMEKQRYGRSFLN